MVVDGLEVLRVAQAASFVILAAAAFLLWHRHRGRSAVYLAAAFATLGTVTSLGVVLRRYEPDEMLFVRDVNAMVLLAFPWLLAAFAWSFTERRLPDWLRVAGVVQLVLAGALLALPPLGQAGERTGWLQSYVTVALLVWLALTGAAAVRLWRAGRHASRVVRARTRAMAAGAVTLGVVLVVNATVPVGARPAQLLLIVVTIGSAALFGIGFAPPGPLRWWWRQLPAGAIQAMQTELIAANTPHDVAAAIAPAVAEMYGGGAVFIDPHGRLLATAGFEPGEAERFADQLHHGQAHGLDHVETVEVEGYCLAVQTSPYAPVFGANEEDLLRQFVLQLRLALQRTELQSANDVARAEMERAYDDQQAMLIGLAHDLRSPTVTVAAFSSMLGEARDLAEAKEMAAGISRSARYLDRLVDAVAELSRIGRNEGQPEPVALQEVVDSAAGRVQASYPGLQLQVEGDLPVVMVDRLRIEQVFDNLIGNAAKHGGRPDVTVVVSSEPTVDGFRVVVTDDGTGVPDEEREAVFVLFRRGSAAAGQGSGIGLGLVRRIVEAYGGRIRFAPTPVGARAEISLPASLLTRAKPASWSVHGSAAADELRSEDRTR